MGGCESKERDSNFNSFSRDSFKQHVKLSNPEEILFEETLNDPSAFFLCMIV